jgi:serine O-acetyltransferase
MSQLKRLLYSDLARQYESKGRREIQPNFFLFLLHLFDYKYLPNVICRISRAAMLSGVPIVPKLLTYLNVVLFGLEVTPKCEIGPGIIFVSSVGCVIGAARIGSNVTVFQGVGLGALRPDMGFNRELRCEIGDNVILGAECKVLGPYHVGAGAVVGPNTVVLASVLPGQTVFGIPARVIPPSSAMSATLASRSS